MLSLRFDITPVIFVDLTACKNKLISVWSSRILPLIFSIITVALSTDGSGSLIFYQGFEIVLSILSGANLQVFINV
jgi:hypothetical protein